MPVADHETARDLIYAKLATSLAASAYPNTAVFYPDRVKPEIMDSSPYIRVFVDLTDERQVSVGGHQQRRYRVYGVVMAQVFTPFGTGQTLADRISGVVKGAFRGVNTGADSISFRHVRVVDVGQDGSHLQTNVIAEFDYDEIA